MNFIDNYNNNIILKINIFFIKLQPKYNEIIIIYFNLIENINIF